MNDYLIRSIIMLVIALVATVFSFEGIQFIYGATIGVIVYAVFDNFDAPNNGEARG